MKTFNLHPYPSLSTSSSSVSLVDAALEKVTDESKAQAYQAWIGYYNSNLKNLGWNQDDLVGNANDYARHTLKYGGFDGARGEWKPPGLFAKTVGKMGLKGVRGLNIVKEPPREAGGQRAGGGGDRKSVV